MRRNLTLTNETDGVAYVEFALPGILPEHKEGGTPVFVFEPSHGTLVNFFSSPIPSSP